MLGLGLSSATFTVAIALALPTSSLPEVTEGASGGSQVVQEYATRPTELRGTESGRFGSVTHLDRIAADTDTSTVSGKRNATKAGVKSDTTPTAKADSLLPGGKTAPTSSASSTTDPAFLIVYGIEYSSADSGAAGNAGKTHFAAAAEWMVPLFASHNNRGLLTLIGDYGDQVKFENYTSCHPVTTPTSSGQGNQASNGSLGSATATSSVVNCYTLPTTTSSARQPGQMVRDSGHYALASTWRFQADARVERRVGALPVLIGAAALSGVEVPPTVKGFGDMGATVLWGLSMSMISDTVACQDSATSHDTTASASSAKCHDSTGRDAPTVPAAERLSFQFLWGRVTTYGEEVRRPADFYPGTPLPSDTGLVTVGLPNFKRHAFVVRVLLTPTKDWYIRGLARIVTGRNAQGPDLLQIALLKSFDLGKVLGVLTGR